MVSVTEAIIGAGTGCGLLLFPGSGCYGRYQRDGACLTGQGRGLVGQLLGHCGEVAKEARAGEGLDGSMGINIIRVRLGESWGVGMQF